MYVGMTTSGCQFDNSPVVIIISTEVFEGTFPSKIVYPLVQKQKIPKKNYLFSFLDLESLRA